MSEARETAFECTGNRERERYLEALGVRLWVRREPRASSARATQPAHESWLLVCDQSARAESRLAADVARCLFGEGRWAWPGDKARGPGLKQTIERCLDEGSARGILVFGQDLARAAFGSDIPASLRGVPVRVAPALAALADQPEERRRCWRILQLLRDDGKAMAAKSGRGGSK